MKMVKMMIIKKSIQCFLCFNPISFFDFAMDAIKCFSFSVCICICLFISIFEIVCVCWFFSKLIVIVCRSRFHWNQFLTGIRCKRLLCSNERENKQKRNSSVLSLKVNVKLCLCLWNEMEQLITTDSIIEVDITFVDILILEIFLRNKQINRFSKKKTHSVQFYENSWLKKEIMRECLQIVTKNNVFFFIQFRTFLYFSKMFFFIFCAF